MLLRILSLIYLAIFITNYYIVIPYFFVFYSFLTIGLICINLKETNNFKRQLENNKFEFYIREYENNQFLRYLYSFVVLIIIFSVIYYIPLKTKELDDIDYIYFILTLIVTTFINWKKDNYDYYYFGEEFIKKPGKKFSKIFWKEVKNIYENEKEELIIIDLHDGSSIKIGTEPYYSFWKKKNEILTYIKNKIK
ncbi:hypothetical protein [Flavobacterium sp. UBA6135]|uniref:hypothetical protein n=1 Tax=Flavobacterium sp. UBA6135 TaxID=1946553 RepID=UPI0025BFC64E|nr:hypothetical protein [Flavobacterium sp. UBA6135]